MHGQARRDAGPEVLQQCGFVVYPLVISVQERRSANAYWNGVRSNGDPLLHYTVFKPPSGKRNSVTAYPVLRDKAY